MTAPAIPFAPATTSTLAIAPATTSTLATMAQGMMNLEHFVGRSQPDNIV